MTRRSSHWSDQLHTLPPVSSVEDFWSVFDKLADPSTRVSGCDIYLFREGEAPDWDRTPAGGAWQWGAA